MSVFEVVDGKRVEIPAKERAKGRPPRKADKPKRPARKTAEADE